jgi:hypothetical protein
MTLEVLVLVNKSTVLALKNCYFFKQNQTINRIEFIVFDFFLKICGSVLQLNDTTSAIKLGNNS